MSINSKTVLSALEVMGNKDAWVILDTQQALKLQWV